MVQATPSAVTQILSDINAGRACAADLLPVVYDDLHRQAAAFMRHRAAGNTLQTTALVNELAGRLLDHDKTDWEGRAHFFGVAAKAMRRILADHARRRNAVKRGGGWSRVTLAGVEAKADEPDDVDLLALHDALTRLGEFDERAVRIVEYRFFGGMTVKEIAHVLGVSVTTVETDWRSARAWLSKELCGETSGP